MKEQLLKLYYKPLGFNDLLQKAIKEISEAMQEGRSSVNLSRNLYTYEVISCISTGGFEIDDKNLEFWKVIWV